MPATIALADVPTGSFATVRSVGEGSAGQGRRLEDLGVLPGTTVRVERRAPLGDPTIYEFRGARVALRRADAVLVQVDLQVDPSPGQDRERTVKAR